VPALKDKVQKERLVLYRDFSTTREFKALVKKLLETHISGLIKGGTFGLSSTCSTTPLNGLRQGTGAGYLPAIVMANTDLST
jgi:hypothetical protein